MLWLRTVVFTILVPGTELVVLPLVVVCLGLGPRLELGPARYSGPVPLLVGLVVILWCFADFVRRGRGTPVGVVLVVVGEAVLSGRVVLFGYAVLMALGYQLFVRYYEEPTLGRLFGEAYARYREAVPRWVPRRPGRTGRCTMEK